MPSEVKLEGFDQLLENIQQLGDRASRVENQALRAGALKLQKAIAIRAPRSNESNDHAADHIGISKVKLTNGIKTVSVGVERTDNSKYFYMKFIEYGTSKMVARPFMAPAAAESQKDIVDAMANVLKGAITGV